jgi:hypothetical protein
VGPNPVYPMNARHFRAQATLTSCIFFPYPEKSDFARLRPQTRNIIQRQGSTPRAKRSTLSKLSRPMSGRETLAKRLVENSPRSIQNSTLSNLATAI